MGDILPIRNKNPEPPVQAVRKQVTVLFCDVVDYTSRTTTMDPEDLGEDMRVFQDICSSIAEKYSGSISNFLGDGILVLFGHPHASEFAPEQAARAGLEMVEEIEQNNQSFEWRNRQPISIRVGIATSLTVVGERAGRQRDQDELIFGEAPTLAARLQSIAKPNSVVTSLRSRRLVGGAFKFKDLGEYELKGFAQPVSAWQLLHERTFQSRSYSFLKRVTTRFISRQQELAFLTDCYEMTIVGKTKTVHLVGEAGIGKSRLLRVFEKTINRQCLYRIRITCSPYFTSSALKPVVEEFSRWLQITPDDDEPSIQARIKWAASALSLQNAEAVSLLCELFAISPPKDLSELTLSAEDRHFRTLDLLATMLVKLTESRPVVLVVEDIHWSDPSTMELLNDVLQRCTNCPLFTVFTSRPGFSLRWHQTDNLVNLKLSTLDTSDARRMIESMLDNTPVPERVLDMLVRKSGGIPLFIEECVWHVLNQVRDAEKEYNPEEAFSVPDSLQDTLNAHLDMLGDAKKLAQLGAAFGPYFTYSNVQRIARLNGIDADRSMDTLLQADFLSVVPHKVEDRYVFRHAMFQDAAYHSLLKKTRQCYHEQIADLFLQNDPSVVDTQPELVAIHYSETRKIDLAVDLWIKAAQNAIAKSAVAEAKEHYRRAYQLLGGLPDSVETSKRDLQLSLLYAVALTLNSGYHGEEVTRTYQHCLQLAEQVGEVCQQWVSLYGYWRCLICQAEFAQAIGVSVKLKRLSEQLADRSSTMTAVGIQAMTRMFSGKFRSAGRYYEISVAMHDAMQDCDIGIRFGQDPYVTIQGLGAVNRLLRNDISNSRHDIAKSVEVARNIGHPYTIAEAVRVAAMYEQIARNMINLRHYAGEAVAISQKYDFAGLLAASRIFLAFSDVVSYRDKDALEVMRAQLPCYKDNYGMLFYPYFQSLLAEAYLFMERYQEAFTESIHVLLMIDRHGEMMHKASAMLIRAESAARGRLAREEEISNWYREATELALQQHNELCIKRIAASKERIKSCAQSDNILEINPDDADNQNTLLDIEQPASSRYLIRSRTDS